MLSPRERKAELVRRGIKLVTIAKREGVAPSSVSLVLTDVRRSEKIEKAIARAIGKPVDEVFPPRPAA